MMTEKQLLVQKIPTEIVRLLVIDRSARKILARVRNEKKGPGPHRGPDPSHHLRDGSCSFDW